MSSSSDESSKCADFGYFQLLHFLTYYDEESRYSPKLFLTIIKSFLYNCLILRKDDQYFHLAKNIMNVMNKHRDWSNKDLAEHIRDEVLDFCVEAGVRPLDDLYNSKGCKSRIELLLKVVLK